MDIESIYSNTINEWRAIDSKVQNFYRESKDIAAFASEYKIIQKSGALRPIKQSQLRNRLEALIKANNISLRTLEILSKPDDKLIEFSGKIEGEATPDTDVYNLIKSIETSSVGAIIWENISIGRARDGSITPTEFILKFKIYFYKPAIGGL